MKIFKDTFDKIENNNEITLTIGNFDGIHQGHQILIKKVNSFKDTKHALMTFNPHPMKILRDDFYEEVSILSQKIDFLKDFNLDFLFIVTFNKEFYSLSKEEFIEFLKRINVKRIIVGKDFRFAKSASGDVYELKKHFEVVIIDDEKKGLTRISTSYIKDLIRHTKLEEAKELLTRDYEIIGKVIDGDKVGRTLGMPTANLLVENYVLPENGVYYVKVLVEGIWYAGALNVGYNPTINYSIKKRVEVHIIDFNKEIYGKEVKLVFKKYLRPEKKFSDRQVLIDQMFLDVSLCKKLFNEEK